MSNSVRLELTVSRAANRKLDIRHERIGHGDDSVEMTADLFNNEIDRVFALIFKKNGGRIISEKKRGE